jgi:hypothetical protein
MNSLRAQQEIASSRVPLEIKSLISMSTLKYNTVAYLRHARTVTSKHSTLRNNRRSGIFSVPCRAAPRLLVRNAAIYTSRQQRINTSSTERCDFRVSGADITATVRRRLVICVYCLFVDVCPSAI